MKNTIITALKKVKYASEQFKYASLQLRNKLITDIGVFIIENRLNILRANALDLEKIDKNNYLYDRLLLNDQRIKNMSQACFDLVKISDPLDKYINEKILITQDNLKIQKIGIPLGVVCCIYEARPNVTTDLTIMAIKSANCIVLKGSSHAVNTNNYLVSLIKNVLLANNISENLIYNYPTDKIYLKYLYQARGLIDVIIPRGGHALINSVIKNSRIPIIETGAGIVHLYADNFIKKKHFDQAIEVIINAKISRPTVCNALDTLIIHQDINENFLINLFQKLLFNKVLINCLQKDYKIIKKHLKGENIKIISKKYFSQELLSLKINIIFVKNIEEALNHIKKYTSLHSDGILSDNQENIEIFNKNINSSVVYENTSTRFSDGGCFGFGGEIGISTQKLHARGPMGAEAIVTYKYIVKSDWKVR